MKEKRLELGVVDYEKVIAIIVRHKSDTTKITFMALALDIQLYY